MFYIGYTIFSGVIVNYCSYFYPTKLLGYIKDHYWQQPKERWKSLIWKRRGPENFCFSEMGSRKKRTNVAYWSLAQLLPSTDCPDVTGEWSRPQCHRQVGVHTSTQSFCQGQLPPHPAAPQAEGLDQHPGLAGKYTTVWGEVFILKNSKANSTKTTIHQIVEIWHKRKRLGDFE